MPQRRILGVFAHPDDEVFCAGGTMAKVVEQGAEAMIVSATRGEAGQIRDSAVATRRTLGEVRAEELRAACRCLGVQHVRTFEHIDGTLSMLECGVLDEEVGAVLDEFRPDVVVTFGPDGFYGHPDHVAIGAATTSAFLARGVGRLYHSHFSRSRLLLVDRLADWLVALRERFTAPAEFARAFSIFSQETTSLGYADDQLEVAWFPPGAVIVEQGEPATSLYLILSGSVEVNQETPAGTRAVLRNLYSGDFFGELAIADGTARTANVVALDSVTCLVFSKGLRTPWAGRGGVSALDAMATSNTSDPRSAGATTVVDVSSVISKKIAALAAHRTQYPVEPAMFPQWLLLEMMSREYFVRIHPAVEPEQDLFG
jgi:LmbE family N-acetylglucosaminyl deacetylase